MREKMDMFASFVSYGAFSLWSLSLTAEDGRKPVSASPDPMLSYRITYTKQYDS